jgi:hypothetical protein
MESWEEMILARQEAIEIAEFNGVIWGEDEEEVVEIYNPNLFPNRKENFR